MADGVIREMMLRKRDQVLRTVRTYTGGAQLRSGHHAEGVILVITKAGKEHMTVLDPSEAHELGMMLLEQCMFTTYGKVFKREGE